LEPYGRAAIGPRNPCRFTTSPFAPSLSRGRRRLDGGSRARGTVSSHLDEDTFCYLCDAAYTGRRVERQARRSLCARCCRSIGRRLGASVVRPGNGAARAPRFSRMHGEMAALRSVATADLPIAGQEGRLLVTKIARAKWHIRSGTDHCTGAGAPFGQGYLPNEQRWSLASTDSRLQHHKQETTHLNPLQQINQLPIKKNFNQLLRPACVWQPFDYTRRT